MTAMKSNRRDFLRASASACLLTATPRPSVAQERKPSPFLKPFSTRGRKVAVYTTAANSAHRMSLTDTLTFTPLAQPLETQVCVFVDPAKSFQTFLGIGGALTDAAAETFARLPEAGQREVLDAY